MATTPQKAFSFMDWISANLIDFTPKKFGLTIEMSWGFVVALAILLFFILYIRIKFRNRAQ